MQCTCSVLAVWAACTCRLHWLCSADCNYTAISLECNCSVQTCYHKRRHSAYCHIGRYIGTSATTDTDISVLLILAISADMLYRPIPICQPYSTAYTFHVLECVCSVHCRALQVHCRSIWVSDDEVHALLVYVCKNQVQALERLQSCTANRGCSASDVHCFPHSILHMIISCFTYLINPHINWV